MDRVLVVTGASRGIGASIARIGARRGYAVCVNYNKSPAAAERVVDEITKEGGRAIAVHADVGNSQAVTRLFGTVDQKLGRVTALVNNAAMYAGVNRIDDMTPEQLQETFATNIFGYFYCAREAVRRMSTRHGGTGGFIVNVSSRGATFGGLPKEKSLRRQQRSGGKLHQRAGARGRRRGHPCQRHKARPDPDRYARDPWRAGSSARHRRKRAARPRRRAR